MDAFEAADNVGYRGGVTARAGGEQRGGGVGEIAGGGGGKAGFALAVCLSEAGFTG